MSTRRRRSASDASTPSGAVRRPAAILSLLSALLLASALSLQSAPHTAAATGDPEVVGNDASAEAPDSITFSLSASSDETIERVELFWRPADEREYRLVRVPIAEDVTVAVDHVLDTRLFYIPPGIDVHWLWQVTDSGGDVTRTDEEQVIYLDPSLDWTVVNDIAVSVYWQDAASSDADAVISAVERTLAVLDDRFDVTIERPMRVVLFDNQDEFQEALPPGSAEWIGGQAHTTLDVFVAAVQPGDEAEVRRLVPHEIVHLALAQETANPWTSPPQWLDEGLAVYLEEQANSELSAALEEAIDEGTLIPLPALESAFPWSRERAILSYAESASVVTYLIETYGDARMAALIDAIADSETSEEAVQTAFGVTLEQIDSDWKAWLGYTGDAPLAAPSANATEDDDEKLDDTSYAIALGMSGFGAIAGVGMIVYGIIRLRRTPRRPR